MKVFPKFHLSTVILLLLILTFLGSFIYLWGFELIPLNKAFAEGQKTLVSLQKQQNGKQELLRQIERYRQDLHALNLVIEAREQISTGADQDHPYLVYDQSQVLNQLRKLLPDDARATGIQINDQGLITLPIESVDYASLGRVLKSFKDQSQTLHPNNPTKPFQIVEVPSGVQRTIVQETSEKNKILKNVYTLILQATLNPEYWKNHLAYVDVELDAYYAKAVEALTETGELEGYPDGTFRPLEPITKAEFFKLALFHLLSTQKITQEDYQNSLHTSEADWSSTYLALADQMGLTEAKPEDGPDQTLTRIEALASILTIFEVKLASLDPNTPINLPFNDIAENRTRLPLVLTAYQKGLLDHMLESFQPDQPVSRAEVAYWVWILNSD